jgi:hypothetical protein
VCHNFKELNINSEGLFTRDTTTGQFSHVTDKAQVQPSNAYVSFKLCGPDANTGRGLDRTTLLTTVQRWAGKEWNRINSIARGHRLPQAINQPDMRFDEKTHSLYISVQPVIEAPEATMQYCFIKSRRAALPLIALLATGAGFIGADAYIHLGPAPAPKEPTLSPKDQHQRDQMARMKARMKHPLPAETDFHTYEDGRHSGAAWNSPEVNKIVGPLEVAAVGAAGIGITYTIGKKYPQFNDVASCDNSVPSSNGPSSQTPWREFTNSISRQIHGLSMPAPEPKAPSPKSWFKRVLGGRQPSRNESIRRERG